MRKSLLRQCIYPARYDLSKFSNGVCHKKGSIFILTLWSLCLLSIFAIGLGSKVSQEINLASYFQNKSQARYLAEAAIKRAQIILKNDTNAFDSLNEFWSTGRYADNEESVFNEVKLGNGVYSIVHTTPDAGSSAQYGMVDEERKININTASEAELDMLWGIGPATAQKVISGRPYQKTEDLLNKKIVKTNVWEEIKDKISVY